MNRINGSPVILATQGQKDAALSSLRLQVSAGIVGQLLPTIFKRARQKAQEDAAKSGNQATQFDAAPAIDSAANLAIATADALLTKLGFQEG